MPTLARLARDGACGNLMSTIPPVSAPAWISFATGKNPGKHGCYDFLLPEKSLSNLKPVSAQSIRTKTFYELMDNAGKKCTIINLPGSFPPRIEGTIITSILTASDECVYPCNLVEEIPELKDYRITADLKLLGHASTDKLIQDIVNTERIRFDCSRKLFQRDWDFFFVLFTGTDVLQHRIYNELVGNWNHPGIELYENLDSYVEWFVDNSPDNTITFLVSDHGFRTFKKTFLINSWLRKEGYLQIRQKTRLPNAFQRPPLFRRQKKFTIGLPLPLVNKFFMHFDSRIVAFHRKLREILQLNLELSVEPNWSQSTAYATMTDTNIGGIYVNDEKRFEDGILDAVSYERIRNEIIEELKQLRNPYANEVVIEDVWKKEDIFSGHRLEMAPDIVFATSKEYQVRSNLFVDDVFNTALLADGTSQNNHSPEGIFFAFGNGVRKGREISPINLCDLAPTFLHILNIPIPEDMDGRVLVEVFQEDCELIDRQPVFEQVDTERDRIKVKIQRLKSCGRL